MLWLVLLPPLVFLFLTVAEWYRPTSSLPFALADYLLNGSGLVMQGLVVPLMSLWLGRLLAEAFPGLDGIIKGALPAFLLGFVGLDFLYYWQHRWLHASGWSLHRVHHGARRLGAWVCSRNSLITHCLFVYLLPGALLNVACEAKTACFAAAMLTASLDLWRHSAVRWPDLQMKWMVWLDSVLITPASHHLHHASGSTVRNFGANLAIWDRCFSTFETGRYPTQYGAPVSASLLRDLLVPWRQPPHAGQPLKETTPCTMD